MNCTETLMHFEEGYLRNKVLEKLGQAETYLLEHRDELGEEFRQSLRQICRKAKSMQTAGTLDKVGYIQYSMLRSAILEGKPVYRIDVYNQKWYFDPGQPECTGDYDSCRIFRFLDEIREELAEPLKLYSGRISPVDLEQMKLQEAATFHQLIINLAGYSLHQEYPGELREVAKEARFDIRVGEYYDLSEIIYREDTHPKDSTAAKEWLEDKVDNKYVAAILRQLDLSGGDYQELDLRRVDFRESNLTGSNFENSILVKADFRDCLLRQADFTGAAIHDADFSGADLKETSFHGAHGVRGMARTIAEGIYSIWGVNFTGADLSGADCRHADLRGADFRGAQVLKVNFDGAQLAGAIFDRSALAGLELDESQINSITWVD